MNYSPLAVSPLYLYNIPMLSYRPVFPQHQSPLPKTQSLISGQLPSVSLLQRCGVDARSLAEIKRRRIGYTSSIYFGVATTQMPAYLQKGLDMIATSAIIYSFILFQHKTACSHLSFCYNNSETAGANALWKKILTS